MQEEYRLGNVGETVYEEQCRRNCVEGTWCKNNVGGAMCEECGRNGKEAESEKQCRRNAEPGM